MEINITAVQSMTVITEREERKKKGKREEREINERRKGIKK